MNKLLTKEDINKILIALKNIGRKKFKYEAKIQEAIIYAHSFLSTLYDGGKLDEEKIDLLRFYLGRLKEIYKGNTEVVNSIKNIIESL